MKDYAAWLKAWETYNLHFYSVLAWLILALVFSLIAGIAFAVARGLAKKEQPDRPGLLVNAMLVVSLAFGMVGFIAKMVIQWVHPHHRRDVQGTFHGRVGTFEIRLPIGEGHRSERAVLRHEP